MKTAKDFGSRRIKENRVRRNDAMNGINPSSRFAAAPLVGVLAVSGPLVGGGSFDITTDAGTELLAVAALGGQRWFGETWGIEAALRAERHFADWDMLDRRSGATGRIDDYLVRGVHLALMHRF